MYASIKSNINMERLKKSPMFSPFERNVLFEILKKYQKSIENKLTDSTTIHEKRDTWKTICKEFNAIGGVFKRDESQLKRFWDKQKAMARKELGIQKRHAMETGGGPPRKRYVSDEVMAQVLSIQPALDVDVTCRNNHLIRLQRADLGSDLTPVSTAAPILPDTSIPVITTTTSSSIHHHLEPVKCGSDYLELQYTTLDVDSPSAEQTETADDPALVAQPSSPAANELAQPGDLVNTPMRDGGSQVPPSGEFVERMGVSDSAQLAEELGVRLQKARIEHQNKLEQLKLDHHSEVFKLKLAKEQQFQDLRIANERERHQWDAQLHNIALQHQLDINAVHMRTANLKHDLALQQLRLQRKDY
uniref:Regulatory protein zeste n=1 Tax=Timema genevievae TaxID=629358 RepID=A0A7R9K8S3_TIMGE|nr:unnamed protein product [Timema genevievae]